MAETEFDPHAVPGTAEHEHETAGTRISRGISAAAQRKAEAAAPATEDVKDEAAETGPAGKES